MQCNPFEDGKVNGNQQYYYNFQWKTWILIFPCWKQKEKNN